MSIPPRPILNVELTPRGQIPVVPSFAPLPQYMVRIPFGLDEQGKHIKDIRGNVIRPVVMYMLECVENRVEQKADRAAAVRQAREEALAQLIERLNACIPNTLYHITPNYLFNEGNLYSYEFNAFLHHICNEMSGDPHYFFNIGLRIIPESVSFIFSATSLQQVYVAIARLGSKFSAEQFESMEVKSNSIVIQRRTPAIPEQLGDVAWQVHVSSGCQTLRGALASFPQHHSKMPLAEIEELKCLLRGDDCCEWKIIWQETEKRGLFSWFR